jgi:hypothetical protein
MLGATTLRVRFDFVASHREDSIQESEFRMGFRRLTQQEPAKLLSPGTETGKAFGSRTLPFGIHLLDSEFCLLDSVRLPYYAIAPQSSIAVLKG